MNKSRLTLFMIACTITSLYGNSALSNVEQITIFNKTVTDCRPIDKKFVRDSIISIKSNTPHRHLNPTHKEELYSGIEVRKLISALKLDIDTPIYIVGDDGYTSMIPNHIISDNPIIIADKKNGIPLRRRDGGVQVIFPTSSNNRKNLPDKYLKKPVSWVWYVSSIIVGEFQNKIAINDKLFELPAQSSSINKVTFTPPLVYTFEQKSCPQTTMWSLDSLVIKILHLKSSGLNLITAKDTSGKSYQIAPKDYFLVGLTRDKALPVICGGPFVLQNKKNSKRIFYHIISLSLEEKFIPR